ncbi:MAG: hypothetical protein AAFX76_00015 [Planctomycetota bacterium]
MSVLGQTLGSPWRDPTLWDWTVYLQWHIWVSGLVVAGWTAVVMQSRGRDRVLGVALTVPCLLYATSGMFSTPDLGWALYYDLWLFSGGGETAMDITIFLGAAVYLCLDAVRQENALSKLVGRCLGGLTVPVFMHWACIVLFVSTDPRGAYASGLPYVTYASPLLALAMWWRLTRFNGRRLVVPPDGASDRNDLEHPKVMYVWVHIGFGAVSFAAIYIAAWWVLGGLAAYVNSGDWETLVLASTKTTWLVGAVVLCINGSVTLIVRTRYATDQRLCWSCGYDLRGHLGTGEVRCPECGAVRPS